MITPVPARAHANMSATERELTFDSLLAEFGEAEEVEAPVADLAPAKFELQSASVPDAAAPRSAPPGAPEAARPTWAARSRALLSRPVLSRPVMWRPMLSRLRAKASPEVLKLSGLIVVAALSLTLVFVALSRA